MLLTVAQGYLFGILIEKNGERLAKRFLAFSIAISLGILCCCKYADFFVENFNAVTGLSVPLLKITSPIGVSFYTFQILSYTVDVYRQEAPAQHSFINLAAYIAMFPQLIAGPIVWYSTVSGQLEDREHSISKAALGIRRFTIGLGKIFGFDFPENFNYPFIAKSATDFWRRWHISLGTCFRDYVYLPLGGNRVSKQRRIRNLLAVWFLTGLWHGAAWNFIAWGLLFGILVVAEKSLLLKKLDLHPVLSHIYMLFILLIGFVLFDAGNLPEAFATIASMFGATDIPFFSAEALYYLKSYGLILLTSVVGSTPLPSIAVNKLRATDTCEKVLNVIKPVFLLGLLCVAPDILWMNLSTRSYISDSDSNNFKTERNVSMSNRKREFFTVLSSALFLFGLSLWCLLKPAESVSLSERRTLAQMPELKVETLLNSKYMTDFEDYSLDYFPLRNRFRSLKAMNSLYLFGQKDINGIYLADGYASRLEYPMNPDSLDNAAKKFELIYNQYLAPAQSRVYSSIIPDKIFFWRRKTVIPLWTTANLRPVLKSVCRSWNISISRIVWN